MSTGAVALAVLAVAACGLGLLAAMWRSDVRRGTRARGRQALQLLHAVAESSPDAVFAKGPDGRYLLCNRAAARYMGRPAEELIGYDDFDVFPRAQAEVAHGLDRMVLESGRVESHEETFDTAEGPVTFQTTKAPLRDEDGRVIGVVGIARDVTRQRREQEQLRQLSQAVEQCAESIVITDLDERIVYFNEAALRSSGYPRAELLGAHARMLQSGRMPPSATEAMRAALARGQPWSGELFNRRRDGSEYVETAVVSPVRSPRGYITHHVAVKQDVTEKRRLDEELAGYRTTLEERVAQRTAELLQARRAAESANEAKSAFLATMSHEIRTPMNGVIGLAQVLRRSGLTPYQSELVDTIGESSHALLAIIDGLLDFSKIEAGHLELDPAPLALRELVDSVCDALQPVAASRGVRLQAFVDPGLPATILADGSRLRQILNNLAGNAVKFCAGTSRTGRVQVRVDRGGGQLRLLVADNGIGMDEEVRTRIFQPYAQGERSTSRRFGGTGLGLSIVQRLVQAMGGRIEVRSAPDQGSAFEVLLPQVPVQGGQAAAAPFDLRGLDTHLLLGDGAATEDVAAYLGAAGATVRSWSDATALRRALDDSAGGVPVLVLDADLPATELAAWRQAAARHATRLVCLGTGRSRRAQLDEDGDVCVDSDALRWSTLVRAVAMGAGSLGDEDAPLAVDNPAPLPTADEAAAQGRLVLVAEDNAINQMVVRRQLALLGLAAEVADDGLQALERWRSGRYALMLTDLHMPGLDGFELARCIRAEEAGRGGHTPIIALTATAGTEDDGRCLAAGMDSCLHKPVTPDRLAMALQPWLPGSDAAAGPSGPDLPEEPAPAGPPDFDERALPSLVGPDPAVAARIRREFDASCRSEAEALRAAVAGAAWSAAGAVAHRLKSSSRAVGAAALGELCSRIELAARAGDGAAVMRACAGFDDALAAYREALRRAQEPAAPAPSEPVIVLVDDDPFQRQVMEQQLLALKAGPVETASSGADAVALLNGRDSSRMLLLLDLNMPGMDGVELMRQLAAQPYRGALALMSVADERVLESGAHLAARHRLNLVGHVHKPVSSAALRTLVARWSDFMPDAARREPPRYDADELRRALRDGELCLHFQPQVSLADGTLVGVESLVRWQHPRDGLVLPDAFVALAEANRLIDALTDEVLELAIAQAARWRGDGLAVRVSVNVSMDNLERLDFPDLVLERLSRHGLRPGQLRLEVTESRLSKDLRKPMDILTRLRLHGVSLAIDDFGTGHSSLAQLRDLPFEELKIDRGFVHGCEARPTQRAIVAASIAMAHQLGMTTVAEGVEDASDWQAMRAAGCDLAQGWLVARPMPGDELPRWAAGHGARLREQLAEAA